MRDLPDAGTQLVDAHEAVNRGVGGEHPTQRDSRVGDCFARPSEAGGEELRQAGCKEEQGRVFWPCEPGPDGLSHEAWRQQKDGCGGENFWEIPKRRKAVKPGREGEVKPEGRKVEG